MNPRCKPVRLLSLVRHGTAQCIKAYRFYDETDLASMGFNTDDIEFARHFYRPPHHFNCRHHFEWIEWTKPAPARSGAREESET